MKIKYKGNQDNTIVIIGTKAYNLDKEKCFNIDDKIGKNIISKSNQYEEVIINPYLTSKQTKE